MNTSRNLVEITLFRAPSSATTKGGEGIRTQYISRPIGIKLIACNATTYRSKVYFTEWQRQIPHRPLFLLFTSCRLRKKDYHLIIVVYIWRTADLHNVPKILEVCLLSASIFFPLTSSSGRSITYFPG